MAQERWGYKGVETSLNGLTGWVFDNVPAKGKAEDIYDQACRWVVRFAKENIDGFVSKGHLRHNADRAAKLIQKRNLFKQFTEFVNSNQ